jgi:hypothetical protein
MTLLLEFKLLEGRFALARLPTGSVVPPWMSGRFAVAVFSNHGLTVVAEESAVPREVTAQRDFRCLQIGGEFAISSVGVVAAAVGPIAAAGVSLFVHSTWETDFILVREDDLARAMRALSDAGHKLVGFDRTV